MDSPLPSQQQQRQQRGQFFQLGERQRGDGAAAPEEVGAEDAARPAGQRKQGAAAAEEARQPHGQVSSNF